VVGSFVAAALGLAVFLWRSTRHPAPVLELSILRVRSFAAAGGAIMLFSTAFGAMLLAGVLFLTSVWDYSVLNAGIAFAPGPATAAIFAVPSGRLAGRLGQRALATAGATIFGLGALWWALTVGTEPNFAGELLPGMLVTGVGVGLTLPSLTSAAAASLPPARLATGSGIVAMLRQLGFVLGVSIFVAIFGTPGPTEALGHFQDGWLFIAGAAGLAGVASASIGRLQAA
jgi:MFS family permease